MILAENILVENVGKFTVKQSKTIVFKSEFSIFGKRLPVNTEIDFSKLSDDEVSMALNIASKLYSIGNNIRC